MHATIKSLFMFMLLGGLLQISLVAKAGSIPGEIFVVAYSPTTIEYCQKRIPRTFNALKQEYEAWLLKQQAEIQAFAKEVAANQAKSLRDPETQQHIKTLETMPIDAFREECQAHSDHFRGVSQKANSALSAPATTWKTFADAMLANDGKTARSCLTGNALKNFQRTFESGDSTAMRAFAKNAKQFQLSGALSAEMVEASVLTRSGQTYFVTMIKSGQNWRIAEM